MDFTMKDANVQIDSEFARLVDGIIRRHADSFRYLATR